MRYQLIIFLLRCLLVKILTDSSYIQPNWPYGVRFIYDRHMSKFWGVLVDRKFCSCKCTFLYFTETALASETALIQCNPREQLAFTRFVPHFSKNETMTNMKEICVILDNANEKAYRHNVLFPKYGTIIFSVINLIVQASLIWKPYNFFGNRKSKNISHSGMETVH